MTDAKNKPTPGPWHVATANKAQSPWVVCDPEGGSIADCEPPGPWMSHETADANARMIAASPDMLSALKASRLYVEILEKHLDPTVDAGAPTIREHAAMVRAAIAKAEGTS